MLGRVMGRELAPDFATSLLTVEIRQRFLAMRAQVVHHQMDRLLPRIGPRDCRYHLGERRSLPVLGYPREMLACLRLHGTEDIGRPAAHIFVVAFENGARSVGYNRLA